MSERKRVRYSRLDEKRSPKNTLYTFQDGENLYFGIARCNVKLGALTLHHSGLRGRVNRTEVKELIEYFRSVDEYLLDQLNSSGSVEAK